jgi:hypothetical protein
LQRVDGIMVVARNPAADRIHQIAVPPGQYLESPDIPACGQHHQVHVSFGDWLDREFIHQHETTTCWFVSGLRAR